LIACNSAINESFLSGLAKMLSDANNTVIIGCGDFVLLTFGKRLF